MFNTTQTLRTSVSVAITAVLLSATTMGQNKTFGSAASGGVRRITLPEAQQQAMAAKAANLAKLSVDAANISARSLRQISFQRSAPPSPIYTSPSSWERRFSWRVGSPKFRSWTRIRLLSPSPWHSRSPALQGSRGRQYRQGRRADSTGHGGEDDG